MKIREYSRFDSPTIDPDVLAKVIGRVENTGDPVVLDLHNNTGNGYTGYHYDPIFPCMHGGSVVGGSFLSTLGDVAKGVAPFLPFLL